MKLLLEIYLVSYTDEGFHFVRKELNISKEDRDPDIIISEYLKYLFADSRLISEKEKYLMHSTSWRYQEQNKTILTYIVYSDYFNFKGLNPGLLRKDELKIVKSKDKRTPRPTNIPIKAVVSHGLRHVGYLIRTDTEGVFKNFLKMKSRDILLNLSDEFAGKI